MFPSKGSNPYGQQPPYAGQQSYGGQIPGSSGFGASAAVGVRAGQGAAGQYGGPYASVYGTQQAGGKSPASSSLPTLPTHPISLSQSSKFSSGAAVPNLARSNDDYMAVRGFAQKLDQYGTDYTLERRMYGEHSANVGRRDNLTDLDRRYPDHIPAGHQASSMRHQPPLKAQLQPGSDMRQADYFAGRPTIIHQESKEIGAYGRVEADYRNLSIPGTVPYGGQGQQATSLLGGPPRTTIDGLGYGQGSSSGGFGMDLPPGRDYASGKGLPHPSLDSDYRDSIIPRARPGISMVDERIIDRVGYRRELDLRDEEHRRDLLLEREKEIEREREQELRELRDRERERNRERERVHDREMDRERLRERERERERERQREDEKERLREHREKERERDRKHVPDSRRERTLPRSSGDRLRSSSVRSEKPLRRLSPRRDAAHRHRSPIKEIKREYICKVLPFRLLDDEMDYLSLTKRYSRLSVVPEFSKVVMNWAKESLNISLHTPVSLEHGIHEDDGMTDERAMVSFENTSSTKMPETIWNAKVLLMSGMSIGALADITSLRSTDERVVHLNNILKFAVLKKDRSLLAIGGPWNAAVDGGDPSVDCSCLIQTAIRYVKELVQVDLSNCTHWNRFLEVHYNRAGKDGLFSHKEVTVLFVPNLSECIPSVDIWKNNWIMYRKSKAERDQLTMKMGKTPDDAKKQNQVSGELNLGKSTNDEHLKEVDAGCSATKIEKVDADMDQCIKDEEGNHVEDEMENLDKVEVQVEKTGGVIEGNSPGDDKKPTKKKIIKKVVKVVRKKPTAEDSADKSPNLDKNIVAETVSKTVEELCQQKSEDVGKGKEVAGINEQPVAKKSGKKKIIRRVVKRKISASASELTAVAAPAETSKQEAEVQPEKDECLTDAGNSEIKLEEGLKTSADDTSDKKKQEVEEKGHTLTDAPKSNVDKVSQQEAGEQKDVTLGGKNEKKDKTKDGSEQKNRDQKMESKKKTLNDIKEKKKFDEPPKHPGFILQAKRSKESKLRSTSLSLDGLLDYTTNDIEESVFELSLFAESFSEMLQYRMGCVILCFLQKLYKQYVTRRNQRKRQREDVKKEDKKSSEKRPRTTNENVNGSSSGKPGKNDEMTKEGEEKKSSDHSELIKEGDEKVTVDHPEAANDELMNEGEEKIGTDHSTVAHDELEADEKMEDEEPEYEEDPEEVEICEDKDMDAAAEELVEAQNENSSDREIKPKEITPEDDGNKTTQDIESKINTVKPKEITPEDDGSKTTQGIESKNNTNIDEKSTSGVEKQSVAADLIEIGEKTVMDEKAYVPQKGYPAKHEMVDKDLVQAFRYFDQNRVGYIKVDDLRCILHNLGKFLSNKDVKDMVQIAQAESNSARDGRVIYTKLVKRVD